MFLIFCDGMDVEKSQMFSLFQFFGIVTFWINFLKTPGIPFSLLMFYDRNVAKS